MKPSDCPAPELRLIMLEDEPSASALALSTDVLRLLRRSSPAIRPPAALEPGSPAEWAALVARTHAAERRAAEAEAQLRRVEVWLSQLREVLDAEFSDLPIMPHAGKPWLG